MVRKRIQRIEPPMLCFDESLLKTNQTKTVDKPIPEKFFKEFLFRNKLKICDIKSVLSYAMAVIATKEYYSIYCQYANIQDMLNKQRRDLAAFFSRKDDRRDRSFDVPCMINGFIHTCEFDDTATIMKPLGCAYAHYEIVNGLWSRGFLNDFTLFEYIYKVVIPKISNIKIKKDKSMPIGPFQYVAFCVATDFLKQVGEQDFSVSELARKCYNKIKQHGSYDFGDKESYIKMGAREVIHLMELIQDEVFLVQKYKDTDKLFELRPYVPKRSQIILDFVKNNRECYSAAIRELFFANNTASIASNSEFTSILLTKNVYDNMKDDREKHKEEINAKTGQLVKKTEEVKFLKSNDKKNQKLIIQLKQQVDAFSKDSAPQVKELESQLEKAKEQITFFSNKYNEAKSLLDNKNNKDSRAQSRIDSLEMDNENLAKEIARLTVQLKEKDDIIEALKIESEDLIAIENGESGFSEEDLQIAKHISEFAFFVPSFVNANPLQSLFPNSKFIYAQDNVAFEIGNGKRAAIVCIKGISHGAYWRMEKQCNKYNIPIINVETYGVKRMFDAAIKEYKRQNLERMDNKS